MRALLIVAVAAVLLAAGLRVWVRLPSREYPADGVHAPKRTIYENRSRR